jgi:hypothetical protein
MAFGTEGNEGNKEFAAPDAQYYLEKSAILRSSRRSIRVGVVGNDEDVPTRRPCPAHYRKVV